MRVSRRKYSIITNTCLYSVVGSAVGFDHYGHVGWIVLGAVAGIVTITTYFVQHWETKPRKVGQESAVKPISPVAPQARKRAWRYIRTASSADWAGYGPDAVRIRIAVRALAKRSPYSARNFRLIALEAALQLRAQQRELAAPVLPEKFAKANANTGVVGGFLQSGTLSDSASERAGGHLAGDAGPAAPLVGAG